MTWPGLSVNAAPGGNAIEATGDFRLDGNLRTTSSLFLEDTLSGFAMELSLPGVTDNRNITFPDASGEVLLDVGGGSLPPGTTEGAMLRWDGTSWVENPSVRSDDLANLHVDGDLTLQGADGVFRGTVDVATLTGDRTYTLPDTSGEISLLGQYISEREIAFGLGPDSVKAASIPYDNSVSGLGALNVQEAIDSLAAGRDGFIRDTEPDGDLTTGQDADIDITGNAEIGGSLRVGDIIGQGTANSFVTGIVEINSTTPVDLTAIPAYTVGTGSIVQLTFNGLFDDRANTNSAYFRVELVRNPGTPGEVVLYSTKKVIYSRVVHQDDDLTISIVDSPGAGTHSYGVRAIQEDGPFDAGRCVNGQLILAEIKS